MSEVGRDECKGKAEELGALGGGTAEMSEMSPSNEEAKRVKPCYGRCRSAVVHLTEGWRSSGVNLFFTPASHRRASPWLRSGMRVAGQSKAAVCSLQHRQPLGGGWYRGHADVHTIMHSNTHRH